MCTLPALFPQLPTWGPSHSPGSALVPSGHSPSWHMVWASLLCDLGCDPHSPQLVSSSPSHSLSVSGPISGSVDGGCERCLSVGQVAVGTLERPTGPMLCGRPQPGRCAVGQPLQLLCFIFVTLMPWRAKGVCTGAKIEEKAGRREEI